MRHRLHRLHVGATYPSLHQQLVHSLRDRALVADPYLPSDEECGGVRVLNHRVHQAVRVNK